MADTIADLQARIHQADYASLPALQLEAESYVSGDPTLLNFFHNHWGRELNKRSMLLAGVPIYTPYGAGYQPFDYVV